MNTKGLKQLAVNAKNASYALAALSSKVKDEAILRMARSLRKDSAKIIQENKKDLIQAKNLSKALTDRLNVDERKINLMADSLEQVAFLKDPVGEVVKGWRRPNGLWIQRVRVPIGVVGIIYESRPNVTSDCVGLCLKSANAVILRGGSEAINTNRMIYHILKEAAKSSFIPEAAINFIDTPGRDVLNHLLELNELIDLIVPRGGEGLIRFVNGHSKIPVIKHYKGICHVYVDKDADLYMAEKICFNAKVQRPGVCNAMETLLAHKDVAGKFLPSMVKKYKDAGVEIRGCPATYKIVKGIKKAKEIDWYREYLDLILSVKVVENLAEAVSHINHYGSHHSDSIVTENYSSALDFMQRVDSACVYANASTRFTDGYEFGLGAEIGISTDKIHARGPMALEELTTYKYMIFGGGQIRQ
jgi:glutamate-5-semialdehyde dehydrogenase